jgi:predicted phosphodiesterase
VIAGYRIFLDIHFELWLEALKTLERGGVWMRMSVNYTDNGMLQLKSQYRIPLPASPHILIEPSFIGGRRLFIVGDIHGCLDEFKELLANADISREKTLIICCGDLVNKGPKSCETVAFVRSLGPDAILSVRGNHDEKVIYERQRFEKDPETQRQNVPYAWVKDLLPDDVTYLRELPYTISIPSVNIIVVHAGLVPGVPLLLQHPINMTTMRGIIAAPDGSMEGTESKGIGLWAATWPGPEHVYFGHNASRGLQRHPFATGLDTGCVYGKALTGVVMTPDGLEMQLHKVDAKMMYRVPDI